MDKASIVTALILFAIHFGDSLLSRRAASKRDDLERYARLAAQLAAATGGAWRPIFERYAGPLMHLSDDDIRFVESVVDDVTTTLMRDATSRLGAATADANAKMQADFARLNGRSP